MTRPLVSIIVPMFNAEDTIYYCLESLVKQTYSNLEIIVVDDFSNDKSVAVSQKFAEDHSNIKIVTSNENGGCYVAFNKGLRESSGDIIGVQGADDVSLSSRIEKQVDHMIRKKAKICTALFYRSNRSDFTINDNEILKIVDAERSNTLKFLRNKYPNYDTNPTRFEEELPFHKRIVMALGTMLARRELFQKYGVFREDSRFGSDLELIARFYCLEYDKKILKMRDIHKFFRQSEIKGFYTCLKELTYVSLKRNNNNISIKTAPKSRSIYVNKWKKDILTNKILIKVNYL